MSGLVLKGDLTEYLGEYLPAPFIDYINVYDSSIEAKISLYLKAPDEEGVSPGDLLERMKPLKTYCSLVIGADQINQLINREKGIFWSLLESDSTAMFPAIDCCDKKCEGSLVRQIRVWQPGSISSLLDNRRMPSIEWNQQDYPLYKSYPLGDFQYEDTHLDENANKIYKYSLTATFTAPDTLSNLFGSTPLDYTTSTEATILAESEALQTFRDSTLEAEYPANRLCKTYQNVALFAWTSPYTVTSGTPKSRSLSFLGGTGNLEQYMHTLGTSNVHLGIELYDTYDESIDAMHASAKTQGWNTAYLPGGSGVQSPLVSNPTLATVGTSKVSYERVIEDGSLIGSAEVIYVDSNETPWADLVLQSLNGKYYKPVNVTHQQIVANFEALIAEYAGTNLSGRMQELLDNISYILGVYGESVELLTQLNSLRMVIPEQGNGTIMGKLFNKITTRIANFDSSLGRENILFPRLAANRNVYDRRPSDEAPWDIADYGDVGKTWEAHLASYQGGGISAADVIETAWDEHAYIKNPNDYLYAGFMESEWTSPDGMTYAGLPNADRETSGYPLINHGYVFFDLEKYLYERSRISQVLDLQKLELWFGKSFINMIITPWSMVRERYFLEGDPQYFPPNGTPSSTEVGLGYDGWELNWEDWLSGNIDTGASANMESPFIDVLCGIVASYFLKSTVSDLWDVPNTEKGTYIPSTISFEDWEAEFWKANESLYPIPLFSTVSAPEITAQGATDTGEAPEALWTASSTSLAEKYSSAANYIAAGLEPEYSYIAPQSFNLAGEGGMGDYRLMCFEWQEILNDLPQENYDKYYGMPHPGSSTGTRTPAQYYKTTLKIIDKSKGLITSLIDSYESALSSLQEYLDLAEEHCSYNNISSEFNQFFINGVKAKYGDNLAHAPWNMVPFIYNLHRDLLQDAFGGSKEDVTDAARKMTSQIGPTTGTLSALISFKAAVQEFYDVNYEGYNSAAPQMRGQVGLQQASPPLNPEVDYSNNITAASYGGEFAWHVNYWFSQSDNFTTGALSTRLTPFGSWADIRDLTIYNWVDVPFAIVPTALDSRDLSTTGTAAQDEARAADAAAGHPEDYDTTWTKLEYVGQREDESNYPAYDYRGWYELTHEEKELIAEIANAANAGNN